jgi:peptidoglycan/LPS O-acetylase OafA/YrhL
METRIAALARLSLRFYNYCGGHFLPAHFRSAGGDNISSKVRRFVRTRRVGSDLQRDAYHRRCPPSVGREDAVRGEWAERPPERRPMKALTGLRFFAALLVVVSHFPLIIPINWFQVSLVRQGAAGVTIFFVLSGFVLTYNYADAFRASTAGTLAFIRARMARIWPINIVSLVIATLLSLWWGTSSSAATWVANLLMLQALVPTKAMVLSWNPPAWSISCELIFYCSFPLFCWVLGRVRCASRFLQLGVAFFAIEVVLFCVVAVAVDQSLHQSGRSALEIWSTMDRIKLFPGLRIWEFLLGCLIGLVFLHARAGNDGWWRVLDRRHARDAMLAASALGLLALFVLPLAVDLPERGLLALLMTVGQYLLYTPLAVLVVTALAWGPTTINPLLEQRWVLRFGEASYSFYMLQFSAFLIATAIAGGAPLSVTPGWWLSAATILVLALVSLATARWIELPARQFLRGAAIRSSCSNAIAAGSCSGEGRARSS